MKTDYVMASLGQPDYTWSPLKPKPLSLSLNPFRLEDTSSLTPFKPFEAESRKTHCKSGPQLLVATYFKDTKKGSSWLLAALTLPFTGKNFILLLRHPSVILEPNSLGFQCILQSAEASSLGNGTTIGFLHYLLWNERCWMSRSTASRPF